MNAKITTGSLILIRSSGNTRRKRATRRIEQVLQHTAGSVFFECIRGTPSTHLKSRSKRNSLLAFWMAATRRLSVSNGIFLSNFTQFRNSKNGCLTTSIQDTYNSRKDFFTPSAQNLIFQASLLNALRRSGQPSEIGMSPCFLAVTPVEDVPGIIRELQGQRFCLVEV